MTEKIFQTNDLQLKNDGNAESNKSGDNLLILKRVVQIRDKQKPQMKKKCGQQIPKIKDQNEKKPLPMSPLLKKARLSSKVETTNNNLQMIATSPLNMYAKNLINVKTRPPPTMKKLYAVEPGKLQALSNTIVNYPNTKTTSQLTKLKVHKSQTDGINKLDATKKSNNPDQFKKVTSIINNNMEYIDEIIDKMDQELNVYIVSIE